MEEDVCIPWMIISVVKNSKRILSGILNINTGFLNDLLFYFVENGFLNRR